MTEVSRLDERRALLEALWTYEHMDGASFCTNRKIRRNVMVRLAAKGLVFEETAALCDGDGFTVYPERYARAWTLTTQGLETARRMFAESIMMGVNHV